MPDLTREEAERNLEKAIVDHCLAFGVADPETHMIGDYIIVTHWQPIVENEKSTYTTTHPRSHQPHHIAAGLLDTGMSIINDTDFIPEDNEEQE